MGIGLVTANDNVERHEVFMRIHGIEIIDKPISLNGIEFFMFSSAIAESIARDLNERDLKHLPNLLDTTKIAEDDFLNERRKSLSHWINKPAAKCVVKCVWKEATHIALSKVRACTHVLNVCALARYGKSNTDVILTPDEAPPDLSTSLISRSLDSWTHQMIAYARMAGQHVSIDEPFHQILDDSTAVKRLINLASTDQPNNFTKSILRAMDWFNRGLRADSRSSKALCFTTALEIMFCRSTDTSKTSEVSESVAIFVANEIDERVRIRKEMKKLYGKRSKLIHDGIDEFNGDDIAKLMEFTLNSLLNIADQCHEYTSLEELTEELQRRKLS